MGEFNDNSYNRKGVIKRRLSAEWGYFMADIARLRRGAPDARAARASTGAWAYSANDKFGALDDLIRRKRKLILWTLFIGVVVFACRSCAGGDAPSGAPSAVAPAATVFAYRLQDADASGLPFEQRNEWDRLLAESTPYANQYDLDQWRKALGYHMDPAEIMNLPCMGYGVSIVPCFACRDLYESIERFDKSVEIRGSDGRMNDVSHWKRMCGSILHHSLWEKYPDRYMPPIEGTYQTGIFDKRVGEARIQRERSRDPRWNPRGDGE